MAGLTLPMTTFTDKWERDGVTVYLANCLDMLPSLSAVDLVIADPPYESLNVAVSTGTTTRLVKRDSFSGNRLSSSNGKRWFSTIPAEQLPHLFAAIRSTIKPTGALYVFSDVKTGLGLFPNLIPANVLVWNKGQIGMGYAWRRMHEWIAYCPMPKHKLRNAGAGDVILCPGVKQKRHPTEKPVGLLRELIANSSDPGNTILDPFMGSGSTGIAAIRLGRKFIGIEKDPEYFKLAVNRLSDELDTFTTSFANHPTIQLSLTLAK